MAEMEGPSYQDQRRTAIEEAAYALLAEKGYKATSMLAVARKAKASNETLYNWYGNKQALFRSLVEANTRRVSRQLQEIIATTTQKDVEAALGEAGSALLRMLTSERAIALNRAAAGDVHDTGQLGQTLGKAGRASVFPLITGLFRGMRAAGRLHHDDDHEIASLWVSVLVGDLQIRLVTGARGPLTEGEIAERVRRATEVVSGLYGAS